MIDGMLPNFIVIGAGKAGTTSLWGYLDGHPDVYMAPAKELNFFTTEHNWDRGIEWYESQFAGANGEAAVGEATGAYTNWPEFDGVPARIASVLPAARLVYIIRDPIVRIQSAYRYRRVQGTESLPFDEAVRTVPIYLNVSRYASQIDRYLDHFSRDQLLVITSEDLRDDRQRTMADVFSFLGVDASVMPDALDRELNRTDRQTREARSLLRAAQHVPGYRAVASRAPSTLKRRLRGFVTTEVLSDDEGVLTDDIREYLAEQLRDDAARLREHLGADFHCWGLA